MNGSTNVSFFFSSVFVVRSFSFFLSFAQLLLIFVSLGWSFFSGYFGCIKMDYKSTLDHNKTMRRKKKKYEPKNNFEICPHANEMCLWGFCLLSYTFEVCILLRLLFFCSAHSAICLMFLLYNEEALMTINVYRLYQWSNVKQWNEGILRDVCKKNCVSASFHCLIYLPN